MISSYARIISLSKKLRRISKSGKEYFSTSAPSLLKQHISNRGYYTVMLTHNYTRTMKYIHRLVAEAFIPNEKNLPQIDHIDANRLNSKSDNLRWCNQSQNNLNTISSKRRSQSTKGKQHEYSWKPIVSISLDNKVTHYKNISSVVYDGHIRVKVLACLSKRAKRHHGLLWMYESDYKTLVNMSKNSTEPPIG